MDSLSETTWDVILSGTGINQSLLALALSRSGKKVLHVDRNNYYGADEAAHNLQDFKDWINYRDAENTGSIFHKHHNVIRFSSLDTLAEEPKLAASRDYCLSLSPQLIYAQSNLLPALVSSKIFRQLEFLAVGSWWLYRPENEATPLTSDISTISSSRSTGCLSRIPGGREDIFGDNSIDLRSARAIMKFLKLAADPEIFIPFLEEWGTWPFGHILTRHFKIPVDLQAPIMALTSSRDTPSQTTTIDALTSIHRHLTSVGKFGPGFASVISKWGGLAEIAQVACRAGAVGGGTYVLRKGIERIDVPNIDSEGENEPLDVVLEGGVKVKAHWIVSTPNDSPDLNPGPSTSQVEEVSHGISIISSPLCALFPPPAEGAPSSAGAVVFFPSGSIINTRAQEETIEEDPPVYLVIHSSDTGECPEGQCIIYANTTVPSYAALPYTGDALLRKAVLKFLASIPEDPQPKVLWSLEYSKQYIVPGSTTSKAELSPMGPLSQIIILPDLGPDLAVDDSLLDNVKDAWEKIVGEEKGDGFMVFEDREGLSDEEGNANGRDEDL